MEISHADILIVGRKPFCFVSSGTEGVFHNSSTILSFCYLILKAFISYFSDVFFPLVYIHIYYKSINIYIWVYRYLLFLYSFYYSFNTIISYRIFRREKLKNYHIKTRRRVSSLKRNIHCRTFGCTNKSWLYYHLTIRVIHAYKLSICFCFFFLRNSQSQKLYYV